MKRTALLILGLLVTGAGACGLLLPDRMVMKGPIFNALLGRGIDAPAAEVVERRIVAAAGFGVALWAENIPGGRFMRFSPGGSLLISQGSSGRILHILADSDGDGRSDGQRVFLEGLDRPEGIDFRDGHLFIGEATAIARVAFDESGRDTIQARGKTLRIAEGLPKGGNHSRHTLRFGPDGGLYVNAGSSCNVCEEKDPRRAAMLRFEADGSGEEVYATGLRNSMGFDWRPGTDELFAVDNGRDLLGDDYPPCELNRVVRGGFYGWPYANGNNEPDPDFGPGNEDRVAASIPPVHPFRAHNAPLGITFLRHPDTPVAYRGTALVALHGSWNRSELDGYKVVTLRWDADDHVTEHDFLTGFQIGDDVIGRPVDVAEGPNGAIYVSDDYSGSIYRMAAGEHAGAIGPGAAPPERDEGISGDANPLAAMDDAEMVTAAARGEKLFAEYACATCHIHGQATQGVAVKPLEGLANRYTVDTLGDFFLAPKPPMPAFPLPEQDRRALAVYLFSNEQRPAGGEAHGEP